jgi:hypothetical protein
MTALRLIDGGGQESRGRCFPPRLDSRSRRPGVAHEELELPLGSCASAAAANAVHDRLPLPLWVLIAIESERALQAAASSELARTRLAARLDWIARMPTTDASRETRLRAWAVVLRCPPDPPRDVAPAPSVAIGLLVPYHTLFAWEFAADRAGVPLFEWARSRLASAGQGRALWEAAAAETGSTLGEWIALSALTSSDANDGVVRGRPT